MLKRGQITLFVVIAIMIVAAVLVFVVIKPSFIQPTVSKEEAQTIVSGQVQAVKDKVETCMNIVVMKSLNTMGRQGGILPIATDTYYSQPDTSVMDNPPIMNYALFQKKDVGYIDLFPSLPEMETSLQKFLENNPDFMDCINNFEEFQKIVNITFAEDYKYNISLSDNVYVNSKWPLKISKGEMSTIIEDYSIVIPINFEKIYETSNLVITRIDQTGEATSYLVEQAQQQIAELRANPNIDTITIDSRAYDDLPSDLQGIKSNLHNTVWILDYKNPALENPYDFYFLTGEE